MHVDEIISMPTKMHITVNHIITGLNTKLHTNSYNCLGSLRGGGGSEGWEKG